MENCGEVPEKVKVELASDSTISLLGIHPEKAIIWKGTFSLIFIAALFTIAKTWKQTKCPLTDDEWWMDKKEVSYVYIYIYIDTHICMYITVFFNI